MPRVPRFVDLRGRGKSVVLIMHEGVTTGRARGPTKRTDIFDGTMRIARVQDRDTDDEAFYLIEPKFFRSDFGEGLEPQIVKLNRDGPMKWEFVEYGQPDARKTEIQERYDRIAELHEEGLTTSAIAEEVGLTGRRVRQIIEEKLDGGIV